MPLPPALQSALNKVGARNVVDTPFTINLGNGELQDQLRVRAELTVNGATHRINLYRKIRSQNGRLLERVISYHYGEDYEGVAVLRLDAGGPKARVPHVHVGTAEEDHIELYRVEIYFPAQGFPARFSPTFTMEQFLELVHHHQQHGSLPVMVSDA